MSDRRSATASLARCSIMTHARPNLVAQQPLHERLDDLSHSVLTRSIHARYSKVGIVGELSHRRLRLITPAFRFGPPSGCPSVPPTPPTPQPGSGEGQGP